MPPLVELRDVSKSFGGVHAVVDASVSFARAGIHGIVGENGAGKSTLSKIISGVYEPDEGELIVDEEPLRFHSPRDALATGIATIAQEIALVPKATVEENVMLGIESNTAGVVRRGDVRRRFNALNERTGFRLRPTARVGALRTAEQQKVEIMRAIARDARMIVMDEPTAALTRDESDRLLEIIRQLAAGGTAVLLISHYLDEVLSVCETVTVMRNGRIVRTSPAANETPQSLVNAMVGREITLEYPSKKLRPEEAPVVLEVRGLTRGRELDDISFEIRAGEILGLAGLVGSGRTEVARAVFGADRVDAGEIELEGRPVRLRSPRQAARHGIAMLPENRKEQGLVMIRSVRENVTLATLGDFSEAGLVNGLRERATTRRLASELAIRTPSVDAPVVTLSGGNQQKVLFAKWLVRPPRVLLADEPTRGVDVGAKRQIHELIVELADQGMAVLLISSELEEVIGLAHRVLVMRRGRIVAEYDSEQATMDRVMAAAFATEAVA
ncbi:MAG: sugar ABC transporter ATP-binding protein [Actinobacteria bacterium]|nr:MAG: sugar ABC transporter ATP-binding protein [Actinomycetota bacterium]